MPEHTFSILVDNKPGVLTRVTGLIARRGYNIESLAVDTTEDPRVSRVTLVTSAEDVPIEQIKKQLNKLINVHKIVELTAADSVDRELVLFKVKATVDQRPELIQLAEMMGGSIADVGTDTLTIEATGSHEAIGALEDLLRPYGIAETARTGKIALARSRS
ncbi:MAG: acetolactate synthase small subunit [Coriobacteriales bacterium]|jgi:acetolactate synthase-1/3 small subunit|nr:acetolactate synthase small subunit [Coriobacteriales bacterium]